MFLLLNLTRSTEMDWATKTFPAAATLADFAKPGDTIELIEEATERLVYRWHNYIRQSVFTYGMERIAPDGQSYVGATQRAKDWLNEQKLPSGLILPLPRCEKCFNVTTTLSEVQTIRDCGLCPSCRAPKLNVGYKKKRS